MGRLEKETPESFTLASDISDLLPVYNKSFPTITKQMIDEWEFTNIAKATNFYFSDKRNLNKFNFSLELIFGLHKRMFSEVWIYAGKKRTNNLNIGISFHKIDEELKKLVDDYVYWTSNDWDILEIATRIHHKLVWIHPFKGGNGRHSRLISNILLYKEAKKTIKWPEDEMIIIKSSFRKNYINALQEADNGNYKKLLSIHKKLIR